MLYLARHIPLKLPEAVGTVRAFSCCYSLSFQACSFSFSIDVACVYVDVPSTRCTVAGLRTEEHLRAALQFDAGSLKCL